MKTVITYAGDRFDTIAFTGSICGCTFVLRKTARRELVTRSRQTQKAKVKREIIINR